MPYAARQDCPRCADLEERVVWLESELGISRHADDLDRIRCALMARLGRVNSGTAAQLIHVLFGAHGRTISRHAIMEAIPPKAGGEDERDPKTIDVWICIARKALGRDAIATARGRGFRMTDAGMAAVRAILDASGARPA